MSLNRSWNKYLELENEVFLSVVFAVAVLSVPAIKATLLAFVLLQIPDVFSPFKTGWVYTARYFSTQLSGNNRVEYS